MAGYPKNPNGARAALLFATAVCAGAAHAVAPDCVTPGKPPASLHVTAGDMANASSTIQMLPWSGGDKLEVKAIRIVDGRCQTGVVGYAGPDIRLQGNLLVTVDDSGAASPVRATPRLPALPDLSKERSHGGDETHESDLGEYITATRIDSGAPTKGNTQYYIGVWQPKKGGSILAIVARQPDGVMSTPAPLLLSTLTVRSVSYTPSPDSAGTAGTIGILQDAETELHLVDVLWRHRDFMQ